MQITKGSWRAPLAIGWALRRARELLDPWLRDGAPRQSSPLPVPFRRGNAATRTALALVPWLRGRGGPAATAAGALVPPRRLRARAGAPGAYAFAEGGRQAATELAEILAAIGRPPERMGSVLDFGCGAARVLPHIAAIAPRSTCAGCDVDATAIEWAADHHPDLDWSLSSFQPPLPYPPESFDVIYAISVFSHLDRELTGLWLDELARVLDPGGVALLSVHGPHAFDRFRRREATESWCAPATFRRGPLHPDESVFAPYVRSVFNHGELPGIGSPYGLSFHGPEQVRRSFGRAFEAVEVRERALTDWQDVVVCCRSR